MSRVPVRYLHFKSLSSYSTIFFSSFVVNPTHSYSR